MKLKNILQQAGLLLAAAASLYLIAAIFTQYNEKSAIKLQNLWKEDVTNLLKSNKLPPAWKKIRIVEKIAGQDDLVAETWLKTISAPIEINMDGEYKLEILFLSDKSEGREQAVVQHHLIHIPSGNSVWELGRTYILN